MVKVIVDKFLRVVGYYGKETAMNEGKKQEQENRAYTENE